MVFYLDMRGVRRKEGMMTEPKDVTFELNVFSDDPRLHLKMTGPGTPPLDFVVAAMKRLNDAADLWEQTHPRTPAAVQGVPPEAEHDSKLASGPAIREPNDPASKKQLGMIRGLCEKVDDEVVKAQFARFGNLDGQYSVDGHYIPSWDFLNMLTKKEAHDAIDALKKFE